jgi:glyoxylase-like metal-dependent hydrolase (beta-lactamase superfamily II)
MLFRQLFDPGTSTYTYLVADPQTAEAVLIDPVLEQVDRDITLLQQLGLTLRYCLETHVHADHITGASLLRQQTGCASVVPQKAQVECASQFMADGDRLKIGVVEIEAIATPGHTDSHLAYLINSTHLLTGDALLIRGCGRTDFQSGDAGALFDGVTQRLFALPDTTLVYPGHDYRGHTVSTIGEEKRWNPRFAGRNRAEFQQLMSNLNLPNPQKMAEAVPANERCGNVVLATA